MLRATVVGRGAMTPPDVLGRIVERLRGAPTLVLFLDYDGTLVPFADAPELASPDAGLLDLLTRVAARPGVAIHIVSGRARESLDRWLGHLPAALHAEHGLWSRPVGGDWTALPVAPCAWRARARRVLEEFQSRTPGSLIEEKSVALAWHYRMVEPELGEGRADELLLRLRELLGDEPAEILLGDEVIEILPRGVHKGRVVEVALADVRDAALVAAIGDDRTDEDLFAALPPTGFAIHVGPSPSVAGVRVRDWREARDFLARLSA